MYYSELFQPILSLGMHIRGQRGQARAVLADVLKLIADTLAKGRKEKPERLDAAWFPVCVWLDEQLDSLWQEIGRPAPLRQRYFTGDAAGMEFYENFQHILRKDVRNGSNRDIAWLYLHCLQLGYQGRADAKKRERIIAQCKDALGGGAGIIPLSEPRRKRTTSRLSQALLWCIPVVSVVVVYAGYRHLLSAWYAALSAW